MKRAPSGFGVAAVAVAFAFGGGCSDPVADARIDSLGPEPGDYPEGPNHRPGQPCTWCHYGSGEAPPFDLAGTVFMRPNSSEPAPAVRVRVFDKEGRQRSRVTTESGNFFFFEGELELAHPLWLKLEGNGQERLMRTPIHRERGCAACHQHPASSKSAGPVYMLEEDE